MPDITKSLTVIPQGPLALFGSFRLDACTSITRSHPGAVFRHPIQSGREGITDAVRIDPDSFSVTGIVSEYPVSLAAVATLPGRAARLYDTLIKMRDLRTALTVSTSWTGLLVNRWVSSVDVTRVGSSFELSLTIEKMRVVNTLLVPQLVDADIQLLGVATVTVGSF